MYSVVQEYLKCINSLAYLDYYITCTLPGKLIITILGCANSSEPWLSLSKARSDLIEGEGTLVNVQCVSLNNVRISLTNQLRPPMDNIKACNIMHDQL